MHEEYIKLQEYVNSDGLLEPDNYHDYGAVGLFQHLCVFCDNVHENSLMLIMGNHQYDEPVQDFQREQVYACEKCAVVIKNFMPKEALRTQLDDVLENRPKSRIIDQYIETGLLPDDTINYSSNSFMSDFCVFCNREAGNDCGEIDIPVGQFTKILGPVKVCSECTKQFRNGMLAHEYSRFDIKNNSTPLIEWDKCVSCKDFYEITSEEYNARAQTNTLKLHNCQSCQPEFWGMNRFMSVTCSKCKKSVVYDLSLYKEKLSKPHTFVCATCQTPELFDYEYLYVVEQGRYMAQIYKKKCGEMDRYLIDFVSTPKDINFDKFIKEFNSNESACPFGCNCLSTAYEAGFFASLKIREYKRNDGISDDNKKL